MKYAPYRYCLASGRRRPSALSSPNVMKPRARSARSQASKYGPFSRPLPAAGSLSANTARPSIAQPGWNRLGMNHGTLPKIVCSTRGAPRTLSRCTAWVNSCTSSRSSQVLLSSSWPSSGGDRNTPMKL
jgi:hypothetical protein